MVRRFSATIQTHEGADRRTVGQAHHIGRNEAECVYVPTHGPIEIWRLQDEVAELRDLRRLNIGRWVSLTRTMCLGALCGTGGRTGKGVAGAIPCMTSTSMPWGSRRRTTNPPPRSVGTLHAAAKGFGQRFEILRLRETERPRPRKRARATRHPVDIGFGPAPRMNSSLSLLSARTSPKSQR